jgi:hypothetical protein
MLGGSFYQPQIPKMKGKGRKADGEKGRPPIGVAT